MNSDLIRAAFEAYAAIQNWDIHRDDSGEYNSSMVQGGWEVWQVIYTLPATDWAEPEKAPFNEWVIVISGRTPDVPWDIAIKRNTGTSKRPVIEWTNANGDPLHTVKGWMYIRQSMPKTLKVKSERALASPDGIDDEILKRMAEKLKADAKREKERKESFLAKDICPECEGAKQQGGQFCGGYWKCETCHGTGKSV